MTTFEMSRQARTSGSDRPLVSMIVISYNHSRYVVETLESVKAQTYTPTELIIVDDCSADNSVAVIDGWLQENGIKCTFIRHDKNQGVCRSLNDGLAAARGKYISMVASDDVWLPDKIARQVEIMESQPDDVGVLYGGAFQIDESGHTLPKMFLEDYWKLPEIPQGRILDSLMLGCFVLVQTALIRRSCYAKVGLYDEELRVEDWDMCMRMAQHYSFVYSPTPFAKYRIHKDSLSRYDPPRVLKNSIDVALKHLRLGVLTERQKSVLTRTVLIWAMQLCERHNELASDILLALWQATGSKRVGRMYRLTKFPPFPRALRICRNLAWRFRNYLWHPILNLTRPVRHPFGLNRANLRATVKRS